MITIDKEKRIRQLLSEGLTLTAIATSVGVGRKLVAKIKNSPGLRKQVSKSQPWKMISMEKENKIRSLLKIGESIKSIVRKMKASKDTVRKIRDSGGLLNRSRRVIPAKRKITPYSERSTGALHNLKEARRCPNCGAKVLLWPCLACNPNVGCY